MTGADGINRLKLFRNFANTLKNLYSRLEEGYEEDLVIVKEVTGE
jgi:hypothetical protein